MELHYCKCTNPDCSERPEIGGALSIHVSWSEDRHAYTYCSEFMAMPFFQEVVTKTDYPQWCPRVIANGSLDWEPSAEAYWDVRFCKPCQEQGCVNAGIFSLDDPIFQKPPSDIDLQPRRKAPKPSKGKEVQRDTESTDKTPQRSGTIRPPQRSNTIKPPKRSDTVKDPRRHGSPSRSK